MLQPTIEQGSIGRVSLFRRVSFWVQDWNWNGFHAAVEEARAAHSSHGFGAGLRLLTSPLSRSSLRLSVDGGLGATRRDRSVSKSIVVKGTKREENGEKENEVRLGGGKAGDGEQVGNFHFGIWGRNELGGKTGW